MMTRDPRSVPTLAVASAALASLLALVAATTPAAAHQGEAPARYVAANGVDEGDCADPTRPCRTLAYALSRAQKGNEIRVASGTYAFDPVEASLLVNPILPVRGGYSVRDGFVAADPEARPTYVIGPPHALRERLAAQGLVLVQDPKGLTAATLAQAEQPALVPVDEGRTARYVDDDGVDRGDCLSPERPCRTIAYAAAQANPGDRILVASGTYSLEPEQTPVLLDETVPVRGGYAPEAGFAAETMGAEPTYLIGPSFEQRARLAARGFTLVQDPKGLAIERAIDEGLGRERLALQGLTPCVDGRAGPYPCRGVDFLGHIPLDQFSSRPAAANDVWGFVDLNDNREYALIGLHNGTAVVGVTDPSSPVEVGTIPGNESTWRDVKVLQVFDDVAGRWNAYAYVTTDATVQGLQVIDLTGLPTGIALAATYTDFASAHNVYLGNVDYATGRALPGMTPYVYIAGSNLDAGAYRILDVSDPVAPVEVTGPPIGTGYIHDATTLVIAGPRAAACRPGHDPCEVLVDYNETTVDIWDVTDKAAPFRISSTPYPNSAYTHSGWWSEDTRFVFIQDELDEQQHGLNTTLRTLDITDLAAPVLSNVWTGPTRAIDHNGFVNGDRYYMSNYRRGLTILDVADPNDPKEVAFFDTFPDPPADDPVFQGAWGTYPYLPSGTVLVSDIQGGLFLVREQEVSPPPPTVVADRTGYAWANDPSSGQYAPSATYAHNGAGGPIEVRRLGAGRYAVRFAGLGGDGQAGGGHVQVTAYGPGGAACKVLGWSSTGADFVANVECLDPAGSPADSRFTVYVVGPERATLAAAAGETRP